MAVKLFRCRICGETYIGESKPSRCPFCGAYRKNIADISKYNVNFDATLNEHDKSLAERALREEISNSEFYICAKDRNETDEGRQLFKILSKVEMEHAAIWRKILKLDKIEFAKTDCAVSCKQNLEESHERESRTIAFYNQAVQECKNKRVKQIFKALVEIETDHLHLSEERLK